MDYSTGSLTFLLLITGSILLWPPTETPPPSANRIESEVAVVAPVDIQFQAHRGSVGEAPENTLRAFEHAWTIPGAIPEADLRTTRDGEIICLHDATLARTTTAPVPYRNRDVSTLSLAQIRQWQTTHPRTPSGEPIPTLKEVLQALQNDPARRLYLDLKAVSWPTLKRMLDVFGVEDRIIFVAPFQASLRRLKTYFPQAETMIWLAGPKIIQQVHYRMLRHRAFAHIDQIQFHLRHNGGTSFQLSAAYLARVLQETQGADLDLMVRPFTYDAAALSALLNLGIQWYVSDEPLAFTDLIHEIWATQRHAVPDSLRPILSSF